MAVATGTMPGWWAEEDPVAIATVSEILQRQAEQLKRKG